MAFVAAFIGLLAVRTPQLLSVAPLLYDVEFLQFGSFALDLRSGVLPAHLGIEDVRLYQYGDHAPGTLWMVVAYAILGTVMEPSVWGLHGLAIASEATAVGLLAAGLAGFTTWPRLVGGWLLWVLAPGFAVVWQFMPFGNHTEFLWGPCACLLALSLDPDLRRPAVWVPCVLAMGLTAMLYRGALTAILALALVFGQDARSSGRLGRMQARLGIRRAAARGNPGAGWLPLGGVHRRSGCRRGSAAGSGTAPPGPQCMRGTDRAESRKRDARYGSSYPLGAPYQGPRGRKGQTAAHRRLRGLHRQALPRAHRATARGPLLLQVGPRTSLPSSPPPSTRATAPS